MLPLITDRNMKISRDYGVLIEDEGIALRGLFIIDPQGILRYVNFCLYLETNQPSGGNFRQITVNDLPVGRSVDETLRLIQAFQFTVSNLLIRSHSHQNVITDKLIQDEHGEVCPANWTNGSKAIKPTPTDKLEYFSAANSHGVSNDRTNGHTKRPRID